MSTKSKLLAMTEGLQLPPEIPASAQAPSPAEGRPAGEGGQAGAAAEAQTRFPPAAPSPSAKTGPGQMLQFRGQMLAVEGELGKLRERLKEHEGSVPTRKLDPACIVPSRWANRHADSFGNADFLRLKQDIEVAGGNVQPIAVRPLPDQAGRYEIVFGHRRHRACSELGLPVLAMVETAPFTDQELFSAMDRENRERADLSAFEQGTMYRRALDAGLYPSNRRLAEALGVSHTWVANVLLVADLPPPVIECFRTPIEIQHRHAKLIASAFEGDRKGVLRRAEKLRLQGKRLAPAAVVEALIGRTEEPATAKPTALKAGGKSVGSWYRDGAGRVTVELAPGVVPEEKLEKLLEAIVRSIGE